MPLEDDYEDAHNGGCNSVAFGSPFQLLVGDENAELLLCGVGGWYDLFGDPYRDTDWFRAIIGLSGVVEVSVLSEMPVNLLELGPLDCDNIGVLRQAEVPECGEAGLTIMGEPGQEIWLWVGSTDCWAPDWYEGQEFDYAMTVSGLAAQTVATRARSLSAVKALFRR